MLLVIVTVLARRLSVAELGAYGLVASLAGYLLVCATASLLGRPGDGGRVEPDERRGCSPPPPLSTRPSAPHGPADRRGRPGDRGADPRGRAGPRRSVGGVGLGLVTAVGIAATVCLDALRAERQFVRAARTEMAAVALYLGVMLALIFAGADLGS